MRSPKIVINNSYINIVYKNIISNSYAISIQLKSKVVVAFRKGTRKSSYYTFAILYFCNNLISIEIHQCLSYFHRFYILQILLKKETKIFDITTNFFVLLYYFISNLIQRFLQTELSIFFVNFAKKQKVINEKNYTINYKKKEKLCKIPFTLKEYKL